jgi:predicted DNA-binding transcriptional regulator YafY
MPSPRGPIRKIRRLLKVVEYLQSGQGYNAAELADFCGVSRRQIFRDLRALQDSGINILYDSQRQAYWLPEQTYLPPTELSLAESLALLALALNLGDSTDGIPLQEPARDAALKLLSSLPVHLRSHLGEVTDAIEIRNTAHHPLPRGRRTFDEVHKALRARRKIRLKYDSVYKDEGVIRTLVSPYRLFYSRRSWYVIGRSSLHRMVRTFHLGRILDCETTEDGFEIPPRFSLDRHFGNAWHMIRDRKARKRVIVRFQSKVARNVADVVWHKTQRIKWNPDQTLDLQVTVDGLEEISWWILGYGRYAEVLEPPELRAMILEHAETLSDLYRESSNPDAPASTPLRPA